jgi:serine/threonine-protein kinase RsbW
MEAMPVRKEWEFPARLEWVNRVCVEMDGWLKGKIASGQHFAIQMLAREALNNAVIHGCEESPEKLVRFAVCVDVDAVHLEVEDEGPGFDWQRVIIRQSAGENEECGRGLLIFRMYADEIEFNSVGNRVSLRRFLPVQW